MIEDDRTLVEADARGRINLGRLTLANPARFYLATTEPDGTIILTPAILIPRRNYDAEKQRPDPS